MRYIAEFVNNINSTLIHFEVSCISENPLRESWLLANGVICTDLSQKIFLFKFKHF